MGSRKHIKAEQEKEAKKSLYFAKLTNNPSSPRKTRLMADLIRGVNVEKALHILQFSSKESAIKLRKLLLSAIANWQSKNEGIRIEDSNLFVKEVFVDGGRQLKRIRTAPQGRAHRIRKRSSHITMIIDSRINVAETLENK
jgi:large subunit ribosomal protein L22